MSQQPVWLTNEGSLGTVPEGRYYKINLFAIDPAAPTDPTLITYTLLAGTLPSGVAVQRNGTIEGIPISVADFKGVPAIVAENTTSKFTIRATTDELRINDRTFTLTVTGQDAPVFDTPAGLIAEYFDGDRVELQIETSDADPTDILVVTLIDGTLPLGLTINTDGLITGYIDPVPTADSAFINFDANGANLDMFPFDFSERSISKNYQFTLQVTDGKDTSIRTFEIFVNSRDGVTADSTQHTIDNSFITADTVATRDPYLLEYISDFGRVRHDNFYAYQYRGVDPNGGSVKYHAIPTTLPEPIPDYKKAGLPETLTLNEDSGWLSGYLTDVQLNEIEYYFTVQLSVTETPSVVSIPYPTKFTVIGEVETEVIWITPEELGTLANGEISTLYVEAVHKNVHLQYKLKSGLYNKLPQGLSLLPSGNIVGRTSFKTFSLDNNATTFDAAFETRLEVGEETTFDRTYEFNVVAYSTDGFVSVTKKFIIRINKETDMPYNILYAKAMPPLNDRKIINNLLSNSAIMVPELLYRPDDANFGRATGVIYQHAFGLSPVTLEDYFESMSLNHYRKTVTLGEIKTAKALDEDGNIEYEVVYSQIIDDMVNRRGESVSKVVDLSAGAINHNSGGTIDTIVNEVYPNSFDNMRDQVVDQIGQISKVLPRWMLSKQDSGRIIGFTPAWVIAYTKPGQSALLAYRIASDFKEHLNEVDFTIDRFTLDSRLSKDWETCENSITSDDTDQTSDNTEYSADESCEPGWAEGVMTTFDRDDSLYGVTTDSNVVTADSNRYINPIELVEDDPATLGIEQETIFDGGSCRFISPVDTYETDDTGDKYIMFPQVKIVDYYSINTDTT